jgi:elongation factor G
MSAACPLVDGNVDQIKTRLRGNPVVLQLPIGAEDHFEGVVDLIQMKSIYWDDSTEGMKFEYREIPEAMAAQCSEYREMLIEAAAAGGLISRCRHCICAPI